MSFISQLQLPGARGLLEILVLAAIFYFVILFFRGTRGAQMLLGFTVVLAVLLLLTYFFHLDALNWLLKRFSVYLALAFVIIFQPEIRRVLAELGKQHVFSAARERTLVDHITQAVRLLAERKIGALVAIERQISLRAIQETGTQLDSLTSPELLASLFFPHTPLHDGGAIIRENRLVAAGCLFPLCQREELSKSLGTRHRAAIGLSEETDAVVVVVSEETGTISLAFKGRLVRGVDEERLERLLTALLLRGSGTLRERFSRARRQLDRALENDHGGDLVAEEFERHGQ